MICLMVIYTDERNYPGRRGAAIERYGFAGPLRKIRNKTVKFGHVGFEIRG